jgi:hypothetical protein
MSRVHIRFDERGEIVEYELAPTASYGLREAA